MVNIPSFNQLVTFHNHLPVPLAGNLNPSRYKWTQLITASQWDSRNYLSKLVSSKYMVIIIVQVNNYVFIVDGFPEFY